MHPAKQAGSASCHLQLQLQLLILFTQIIFSLLYLLALKGLLSVNFPWGCLLFNNPEINSVPQIARPRGPR